MEFLAELFTGINADNGFVTDVLLGRYELLGELVVKVGSVRDDDNGRRTEELAFHQHTGKEHHRVALAASGSTEVCTTLAVACRTNMFFDVVEQFMGSKELRIATNYLQVFVRIIGEVNEVLNYRKETVFAEQALHHRNERVDAVKLLVAIFDFSPRIEEVVR